MRLSELWHGHRSTRRHVALAALATGAMAMAMLGGAQAASASTARPSVTVCHGGPIGTAGQTTTYGRLVVDGFCEVPGGATVVVDGNTVINTGATLMAPAGGSNLTVRGNISVATGGILYLGVDTGEAEPVSVNTVRGNIRAHDALSLYLFHATVDGNVTFRGGGWGPSCTDTDSALGHDLMVKDSAIRGNLTLTGWSGCWMGALRNAVSGNMTITHNYANPGWLAQGPDSTEIGQNTVQGNLVCAGNTPHAQFGDSGSMPNVVSGMARGECAALSVHP